jgi:carboxylesterase
MEAMSEQYPVMPGAEPWRVEGTGARGRIGIGVIHGFTGNPVSMRPLAEALAERGFTVDMPRLPGHGTHWKDMAETGYDDWYAEVSRTVDSLKKQCAAVVLVGLSMGGTLVLDAATRRQGDVAGVMAVNALMLSAPRAQVALMSLLSRVVVAVPGSLAGLAKNDIAKGGDEQAYPKVPLRSALSLLGAVEGIRGRLPQVRIPAVIAYSREDHSVPNRSSKEALSLLGTSDKREVVLERSYHVATLDFDLGLIVDEATELADRVGGAPRAAASTG